MRVLNVLLLFLVQKSDCGVKHTLLKDGYWTAALSIDKISPKKELTACEVIPVKEMIPSQIDSDVGYVTLFDPVAKKGDVHHLVVRSCKKPLYGSPGNTSKVPVFQGQCPCTCGSSTIIFTGMVELGFPDDVSFVIHEQIQHVALEIHFARDTTDTPYLNMHMQMFPTDLEAQMIHLENKEISIPPGKPSSLIFINCRMSQPMRMIAARIHTHEMGKTVRGFKISGNEVTEMFSGHPQESQAFHEFNLDVVNKTSLEPDDYLAATCEFDSSGQKELTTFGITHSDEMCISEIMVAMKLGTKLEHQDCFGERSSYITSLVKTKIKALNP